MCFIDCHTTCIDKSTEVRAAELWHLAADVSLAHNVVLSPRVFDRARWDEVRRIRMPLYRAIVADGIPLTPEMFRPDLAHPPVKIDHCCHSSAAKNRQILTKPTSPTLRPGLVTKQRSSGQRNSDWSLNDQSNLPR